MCRIAFVLIGIAYFWRNTLGPSGKVGGRALREEAMERRLDEAQDSLYGMEHWLAWFMAVGAIVLGVIGMLVGFGIVDLRGGNVAGLDIPGLNLGAGNRGVLGNNFWDGAMWLFAAISASVLAYTLHTSDHHRVTNLSQVSASDRGLWSTEHSLAYLFAVGTVVLVVIGLLTGYQTFSNSNTQFDGLIWIWAGFGTSVLTMTLHAVRHHQVQEDYIMSMLQERTGRATPAATPMREPGTQRTS
jgi:hypothetical protein